MKEEQQEVVEEQQEAVGEFSETTDIIEESVDQEVDELPEFGMRVLEVLRQPLEDKVVTISRAQGALTYPAKFQLIASMIRLHGEGDESSTKEDLLAAAEDRIMAIALVHEYLYSSEELSAIDLADYLDGLIAHMRSAHSGVQALPK